jgi:ComF family protein
MVGATDMRGFLRKVIGSSLSCLFPNRCFFCGAVLVGEACICPSCGSGMKPIPPDRCVRCGAPSTGTAGKPAKDCPQCREFDWSFSSNMSIFEFTGMTRDLVHQYKFRGRRSLHRFFADRALCVREYVLAHDVLVPVPLTPRRAAGRGFNQSELIARRIGRALAVPCLASTLKRRGTSPPQSGVPDLRTRVRNVRDQFFLRRSDAIRGRSVLLVDDVLTTGATASACARVLLDGGARKVDLLTIARTVRKDR